MTNPADLPDWQTKFSPPSDALIDQLTLASGTQTNKYACSQFNSIQITKPFPAFNQLQLIKVNWIDINNNVIDADIIAVPAVSPSAGFPPMTVPVRAPYFAIYNGGGSSAIIWIVGSSRTVPGLTGVSFTDLQQLNMTTTAMTAGNVYPISPNLVNTQGLCYLACSVGGTTVKGIVEAAGVDNLGNAFNYALIDTGEMSTVGASQFGQRQVILPASPVTLQFRCEISGSAAVNVSLCALGH